MGEMWLPTAVLLSEGPFSCRMASAASLPRVLVLATGGTIAGSAPSPADILGYRAGVLGVDTLLAAVPELSGIAAVTGEQICNIDSKDMTDEIWRRLALRVRRIIEAKEADGIVITHGTDTMEETAFFLALTVDSETPVVLTGAMRPATAAQPDGPRNLLDAVRVAASPEARGKGVLVVMNGDIHAANEVTKTHTTNLDAFASPEHGPLGHVGENGVSFSRAPRRLRVPIFPAEAKLPRVDILYGHEGDDGALVGAALSVGAKGIVYAGLGNGSIPTGAEQALAEVMESAVIVRASRVMGGAVTSAAPGNFIDSATLSPAKARVLLRLALANTEDRNEIGRIFREQ